MNRRELIKSAMALTAGTVIPITVASELSPDEVAKEIDQQIAKWIPMVEKAGLSLPIEENNFDAITTRKIGACAYIGLRVTHTLD